MTQHYAVTITRREHAELLPVAPDELPSEPNEVMGQTMVSLISAGTELAWAYQGDAFPRTPGYAAVFRVEQVGAQVQRVQAGDVVFCMGSHASHQRHRENEVLRLPENLPPAEAVFARLMGVSMSTVTTTTARPPARIIVAGLGPVGHLAAKIFNACGYEVLACDPNPARRDFALQHGILNVRAAIPLDDAEWCGKTALVVECSGHEQSALDGCRMLAKRGELVLVGVPWKQHTQLSAHELLHAVFHRYAVVRSGWEWELPLHATDFRPSSIWDNYRAALSWLHDGRVSVQDLYTTYSPQQCQEAYQALLHNRLEKLAVVFDWTQLGDQ